MSTESKSCVLERCLNNCFCNIGHDGARICGLENFECYTQAIYKHLSGALDTGVEEDYIEPPITVKPNASSTSNTTTTNDTLRTLIQERRYPFYLYKYRQWQERHTNNSTSGSASDDANSDEYDSKYDHVAFNYKCKCLPACNSINYMADYRTSSFYLENAGLDYNKLPLG